MRTLWLCQAVGGPFEYTGKKLGEAHKDLHITAEEFDEVGAEIARALDHCDVPEREKQEVLTAIVAQKTDVINPLRWDPHCCRNMEPPTSRRPHGQNLIQPCRLAALPPLARVLR